MFAELGTGQPTSSYKRFVEQGIDEETEKFYAKGHWPAVRGSEKFAEVINRFKLKGILFGATDNVTKSEISLSEN